MVKLVSEREPIHGNSVKECDNVNENKSMVLKIYNKCGLLKIKTRNLKNVADSVIFGSSFKEEIKIAVDENTT